MTVIVSGTAGITFPDNTTQDTAGGGGGGGPGVFEAIQSANFTATANSIYAVNTAAATIYANLPATPSVGQYVTFIDFARTFATNNLIINPNGSLVEGISNTSTIGVNGAAVSAIYSGSVQGWLQYSGVTTPQIGGYAANYVVVAGGGSGALAAGFTGGTSAGGGAGGYLESTTTFVPGASYTITIGAGGAAVTGTGYALGNSGSNSSMVGSTINVLAIGGGYGGGYNNGADGTGGNGGSGGGAGYSFGSQYGTGTVGQGNRGGSALNGSPYSSGGGGGASQVGFDGTASPAYSGAGGNGTSSTISGTAVTRAGGGGGGGGSGSASPGAGGVGGGGAGGAFGANGTAGTANTGGGGGASGAATGSSVSSGAGGSGVVILSYQGSQRGSGGTVSSAGGYTIHTFTSSGSYTA